VKIVRLFVISVILCLIVLFSFSCAGNPIVTKPKNPLVGKWEVFSVHWTDGRWENVSASDLTFEFFDDGTLITSSKSENGSSVGSYKIIDQNRVELKIYEGGIGSVFKFSVSVDELTIQGMLTSWVDEYKLRKAR